MPLLAIFRHDLRSLMGSWLVRLWLVGTVFLTALLLMSNWQQFQDGSLIASVLFPYLVFPWFLVVMVLGVNPVSGTRVEALADGILSRPVTRYEYLLASWLARMAVVVVPYLAVMIGAILLVTQMDRSHVPEDSVTFYGIVAALGVVGLVLTFQVSLAFMVGTFLRKPLLALLVLLGIWYPVNGMLAAFQLEEFSPISLSQAIPTLLREPWREGEAKTEEEKADANYEAVGNQIASFLSGGTIQEQPETEGAYFDSEDFEDFSLIRVLLGYGIPTLLSISLAMFCFYIRDL